MSQSDEERWNQRYRDAAAEVDVAACHAVRFAETWLPRTGTALDIAGGLGRHAFHLARRGLTVTLLDVSVEAVTHVNQTASQHAPSVTAKRFDVDTQALPEGPFDVVVCTHFLHRPLFASIPAVLRKGGVFVFSQPTVKNLERHPHPSARFLLQVGELAELLPSAMQVLALQEDWTPEGTHEAWVVARRP